MNLPNNKKYDAGTLDRIAELWARDTKTSEIARILKIPLGSTCRLARNARLCGDPRFPVRPSLMKRAPLKPEPKLAARKAALPRRRVAKPAPKPVSAVRPRIWELRENQCRYPVHETDTREHLFCAAPTREREPYCPMHSALCNNPPHAKRAA